MSVKKCYGVKLATTSKTLIQKIDGQQHNIDWSNVDVKNYLLHEKQKLESLDVTLSNVKEFENVVISIHKMCAKCSSKVEINPGEKTNKCLICGQRMLTSKCRTGFEGEIDINNDSQTVSLKIGAAVLNRFFEEDVISKYTPDKLEEKLILLTNVDIMYKKNSNVITTIRKSSVQE